MKRFIIGLAIVALFGGCSGGTSSVQGSVSYDGQPIQNGTITMIPTGGEGAKKVGTQIVDGKYQMTSELGPAPGSYKVEIHWKKPTGKKYKSDAGEFDVVEEGLPAKYHAETSLTTVIKSGANKIDFNLEK